MFALLRPARQLTSVQKTAVWPNAYKWEQKPSNEAFAGGQAMEELRIAEGKCNIWKVKLAALVYWLDTGKVKRRAEGCHRLLTGVTRWRS